MSCHRMKLPFHGSVRAHPTMAPMPHPRPTRTIALPNQKGGVGKTTTAVNLAAAIAGAGRRVLLIDLDPQAHATLHVGLDAASGAATVYDLLLDPQVQPAETIVEVRPNLAVIPSTVDLA